ncbi:NAD(P)-binding protein [Oribacterium sinus]|uniref:NAD(P)-binding protein n=1 Tax=Oribacterium sinus TaxID=237576 RepID=UPI0028E6E3A0|nr:NAD(P)-binding protein [Oribacterium sinus]
MILCSSKNLTLPKPEESFFSDLLVVGGGCSGLAAISAAADLGIENSLLLEKEESLGGRLGKSTEEISGLFTKTVQPKELLAHFSLFLENYGVAHQEGVEVEEIYVLSREALSIVHSQDEASAYRYLLKAKTKEGSCFFIGKALVLAVGALSPEENAAVSALIKEEEKKTASPRLFLTGQSLAPSQSIAEAVQSGGAVGRMVGEMLLKEKHKQGF